MPDSVTGVPGALGAGSGRVVPGSDGYQSDGLATGPPPGDGGSGGAPGEGGCGAPPGPGDRCCDGFGVPLGAAPGRGGPGFGGYQADDSGPDVAGPAPGEPGCGALPGPGGTGCAPGRKGPFGSGGYQFGCCEGPGAPVGGCAPGAAAGPVGAELCRAGVEVRPGWMGLGWVSGQLGEGDSGVVSPGVSVGARRPRGSGGVSGGGGGCGGRVSAGLRLGAGGRGDAEGRSFRAAVLLPATCTSVG